MVHIAESSFIQQLQSMTSATENNNPNDTEISQIDASSADRKFVIYLVDRNRDEGDAPTIRFGASMRYLFADPLGLKALERFLDSYAGSNLEIIDTIRPPFDATPSTAKESLTLLATSLEKYAELKERARDRVRSRLAASNHMRWHQLHGYNKAEAQRERAEIRKFLVDNGVDPQQADENLDLLEHFYANPAQISNAFSTKGE